MVYGFAGRTSEGELVPGDFKATKNFIRARLLDRLKGTGERVLIRALDDEGRYLA
jgi:hypothetical protein